MNNGQWIVKISLENRVVKRKIWHFLDARAHFFVKIIRGVGEVNFASGPLFFLASNGGPCLSDGTERRKRERERKRDLQSLLSRQQQGRRTSLLRSPIFRDYAMDIYIYIYVHYISYNPTFMEQTFLSRAFCVPRSIAGEFFQTRQKFVVVETNS